MLYLTTDNNTNNCFIIVGAYHPGDPAIWLLHEGLHAIVADRHLPNVNVEYQLIPQMGMQYNTCLL